MAKKIKGYAVHRGIVKTITLFEKQTDAAKVAAEQKGVDGWIIYNGEIVEVRTVVRNNVVRHYTKDGQVVTWGSAYPTRLACKRARVARAVANVKTYEQRVKEAKRELDKARRI